jgi:hypothetical protein
VNILKGGGGDVTERQKGPRALDNLRSGNGPKVMNLSSKGVLIWHVH